MLLTTSAGRSAGLHIHRSESAQRLVEELARLLADDLPDDPLEREVVAVPARGLERWIAQQLASRLGATDGDRRDGVCARVDFPRPDDLLLRVVAAASPDHARAVDAWRPARAVWSMLDVLDELLLETPATNADWCPALRWHLTTPDGSPSERRYGVARKLTELFVRYAAARPDLIRDWSAGGATAPPDLDWQPELWRRLATRIDHPSPAVLLDDACAALRRTPDAVDLPARLSFFGLSRLDAANLQVLEAVAAEREVHLWLNSASPALWDTLRRTPPSSRLRSDLVVAVTNPLLASLSRDIRELQVRLQAVSGATDHHHPRPTTATPPATLLERLQSALATDSVPATRHRLAPGDRSVQVHACHGRGRQVEVLREVITGLLQNDPSLQPRDVLIMCPDVEAFAPLIGAAFTLDGHPAADLRVAVADRSPRRANPLLGVTADLLDLAAGRVTATGVLDLAAADPVRLRFGFDDGALEQLRAWTVDAGIRWGLDGEHRDHWQLGGIADGTWRAGIDRLLAGVALDPDIGLCGPALPVAGVESTAIDLAGRFAEFADRIDDAVRRLAGRHPVAGWLDRLEASLEALTDVPVDEPWQAAGLRRELAEVHEAAQGSAAEICLAEFTALVAGRLEARPTSAGFREGGLTVCTLTPMRSVPHKVVCLLGMDDGAFPRRASVHGDDLLLREPRIGERDPRTEDRQLLLDALYAAERHLVVTYCGADVRTGAHLPPAVPIGELLDALDALAEAHDGRPVREAVIVSHPLQPFDRRNFEDGRLGRTGPFSFDRSMVSGANALAGPRTSAPALLVDPLGPPGEADVVRLDQLVSFWLHPTKEFLRQRLGVSLATPDEFPDDALPVDLDALARWGVGDRLLHDLLRDADPAQARVAEQARGALPPSPVGDRLLEEICAEVHRVLRASADVRVGPAATVELDLALPAGPRLTGAVGGLHRDVLLTVTYSKIRAKQRLRAWVQLLALTAADPGRPWRAVVVGQHERNKVGSADNRACVVTLDPLGHDVALAALAELVRLRAVGMCTPLPLPVNAGECFAKTRAARDLGAALDAAEKKWCGGLFPEHDDDAHVLVWGRKAPFEVLSGWTAPPGTFPADVPGDTDFERLARAVWDRLLAYEQQERR